MITHFRCDLVVLMSSLTKQKEEKRRTDDEIDLRTEIELEVLVTHKLMQLELLNDS